MIIWLAYCENECLGNRKISKTYPDSKPDDCPFCGLERKWIALNPIQNRI